MAEHPPDSMNSDCGPAGSEELPEATGSLLVPQVLRCTRSGTVIGRSSLEEAYGEAQQGQNRQQLLHALQCMTLEEKLRCCSQLKEKGNERYAAGEYIAAISCYEQGLMALDFGSSEEQETQAKEQLLLPLLLNLSACLLKLRRYAKARAVCDIALRVNPQSVKALYRRGVAEKELGNLKAAKIDFRKLLSLCEKQQQTEQHQGLQQHLHQSEHDDRKGQDEHRQPIVSAIPSRKAQVLPQAAAKSATACNDAPGPPLAEKLEAAASDTPGQSMSLVMLCRRQLANVYFQERQYNAACSRMFKPRIIPEQHEQQPEHVAAPVGEYKKTLGRFGWDSLQCWTKTCLCKRRNRTKVFR